MKQTAGRWDPSEQHIMFLPGNSGTSVLSKRSYEIVKGTDLEPLWLKVAGITKGLNKLISLIQHYRNQNWKQGLQADIDAHNHLFLDSGVFTLAMNHAKAHGLSHNEALNVPPDQIDGWEEYFSFYVDVCKEMSGSLWGYVELDLGGTQKKIETRTKLEAEGLAPIPVWHPLTDGLEYGDFLMKNYDRICVGNLVKSDEQTRNTVLRAVAKVKGNKKTPWVHALGLAIVPYATAYPINSLDAMTWMNAIMYPKRQTYALMHKFEADTPRLYDHRDDYFMASAVLQRQAQTNLQNWRSYETAKRRSVL